MSKSIKNSFCVVWNFCYLSMRLCLSLSIFYFVNNLIPLLKAPTLLPPPKLQALDKVIANNTMNILTLTPTPPRKGTGPKWGSPLDTNRGSPTSQCTVHPWHATQVSLPQQQFCSHMIPASKT